jgi:hypothetical protein
MATQIVELSADEAALLRSYDRAVQKQAELEAKLRAGGQAGDAAGTQIEEALLKVKRANDQALKGLLGELKNLGSESGPAADALKAHFQAAGKAGYRSMGEILDQIRAIDPAAADAAGAAQQSLVDAASTTDARFREVLANIGALGPEGRQAAAAIKASLVEAGKLSEKSIADVAAEFGKIDLEAANAASVIIEEMQKAASSTEARFREVLDDIGALGPEGRKAAAAIKASLVEAGKLSEKSIEDVAAAFDKIDPQAAEAARAIIGKMANAADQSESAFTGFGRSAMAEIAGIAGAYIGVGEAISKVTQFLEDQKASMREAKEAHVDLAEAQENAIKNLSGLSKEDRAALLDRAPQMSMEVGVEPAIITQALGEVASTGMNDAAQIESTVAAAARLNRMSPEDLPAVAAGTADILSKTGLRDVRQAAALMTTAGSASRVDASELQDTLPRALGAGINTAPKQDKEEASRETAALFAQASNMATDATGKSTATFTIDLLTRMEQFFDNLDREQVKARSKIDLIDRRIAKGNDTEFDRLEKQELSKFLSEAEGVSDPGTQFGRLSILQNNEALASEFTGESGFGEKEFATFLKSILDGSSEASQGLGAMKDQIKTDTATYEAMAKELESATGPIAVAVAQKTEDAQMKALDASRTEQALVSTFNEDTQEVLRKSRSTSFTGFANFTTDWMSGSTRSAPDAALQNILALEARAAELRGGGITQDEAKLITKIEGSIANIFTALENSADKLDPELAEGAALETRRSRAAFDERIGPQGQLIAGNEQMVSVLTRLETILNRIAVSNEAMVEPARVTAERATVTPNQPALTPILSQSAP